MFLGPSLSRNSEDSCKQREAPCREAYFIEFANSIRLHIPEVPLIVTGGFRSCQSMEAAVDSGACDLIGLGRPAIVNPLLPKAVVLNTEISIKDATLYVKKIKVPWIVKQIGIRAVEVHLDNVSKLLQINDMMILAF